MKLLAYLVPILLSVALVAGCGSGSDKAESTTEKTPLLTAATLGEQTVLSASEYLAEAAFVAADRDNGARQVQICKACHSLGPGGPNMLGPALYGFFGREAGSNEEFDYSPALRAATFVWTPRALEAWLAQPGSFLPGNRMVFGGIPRQQDRRDLIAFLLEVTAPDDGS